MADPFDQGRRSLQRMDPPDLWREALSRADRGPASGAAGRERPLRRRAPVLVAAVLLLVALIGTVIVLSTDGDEREPATAGEGEGAAPDHDPRADPEGIGGPCPFVLPGFGLRPGPPDPMLLGGLQAADQSVAHAGEDGLVVEVRAPASSQQVGPDAVLLETLDHPRGTADVLRMGQVAVVRVVGGGPPGACDSFDVAVTGEATPNDDAELAIEASLRLWMPGREDGPPLVTEPLSRCSALALASSSPPSGWSGHLAEGTGDGEQIGSSIGHFAGPESGRYADVLAGESPFPLSDATAGEWRHQGYVRIRSGPIHERFAIEVQITKPTGEQCPMAVLVSGATADDTEQLAAGLYVTDRTGLPWFDGRGAVWPESSADQTVSAIERLAGGGDSWREDGDATAVEFGREVLGWQDARLDDAGREPSEDGRGGAVRGLERPSTGERVAVWVAPTVGMRWLGVYRVEARPPGDQEPFAELWARVTITPDRVAVLEWYHPFVPHEVELVVGHGERVARGTIDRYDVTHGGSIQLDHEPDTTGFVLVLLRDETGRLAGATGRPLPAGPVEGA